ncbi:hypothetical protein K438DRAFT_1972602 [Mycena galopus ATCC 62051]|nr:hypothetical protein K438DRAFT_1972602 [Mycena galopus ATCC 62051]
MNRNIIFHYLPGELKKNVNLLLAFTPPTEIKLSDEQQVVAWKVIAMRSVPGSKAMNTAVVAYSGRLAFGVSQDENGNILYGASTLGSSVDLTWSDGTAVWGSSTKSGDRGTLIKAKNTTPYPQSISLGTLQYWGGVDVYSPTFVWKAGSKLTVEVDFRPMLKAYVNTMSIQNEFITADITGDMITDWNLAELPTVSHWKFAQLPEGRYEITLMKFRMFVQ